jgi:hypothetical protein
MSGIENWLSALAPGVGGSSLSTIVAAAVLAALAVVVAIALLSGRAGSIKLGSKPLLWGGVLVVFAALLAFIVTDGLNARDHAAARRALNARAADLTARALVPGSPLACLDSVGNTTVEAACERLLFASAESTAAAVAYVDARLALLADGVALAARDPDHAALLERPRRAIETDRFGIVAHILAARGCTASQCPEFKLLRDPQRVAANLGDRTFDGNILMYASSWPSNGPALAGAPTQGAPPALTAMPPTASGSQSPMPGFAAVPPTATTGASGMPVSPKYDFPSAASIPPVSIMNAEPPAPPEPSAAKPAAPAQPQRRAVSREPPAVPLPAPLPAPR